MNHPLTARITPSSDRRHVRKARGETRGRDDGQIAAVRDGLRIRLSVPRGRVRGVLLITPSDSIVVSDVLRARHAPRGAIAVCREHGATSRFYDGRVEGDSRSPAGYDASLPII